MPDGAADLVLAKSLFTHLLPDTARRYLSEIRRCLSPGGTCLLTAFVFDGSLGDPPAFPHHGGDTRVRWRRRARPEAAVACERSHFEEMLISAGLTVVEMLPGFWPGAFPVLRGQDTYILKVGATSPPLGLTASR